MKIVKILLAFFLCFATINVSALENKSSSAHLQRSGRAAAASSQEAINMSMLKWGVGMAIVFAALAIIFRASGSGNGSHSH
jgi:hypothetical protein